MTSDLQRLGSSKYVAVATYKKDGTAVSTPVWIAPDGDSLVFWTISTSWKVKRIRNNPAVAVVVCNVRGAQHSGDWVRGTAEVLDAAGSQAVRDVIARKYGMLGWVSLRASELRRGKTGTVGIRIRLDNVEVSDQ